MTSKSDIIYRKLVLAHKLISDSDLLQSIVEVEAMRSQGDDISLLEILLKKNQISPDDGLILRSEHDRVKKLVKDKTSFLKKQSSNHLEKTIIETVEENASAILGKKSTHKKIQSGVSHKKPKRKTSKPQSKIKRVESRKVKKVDDDRTLILPNKPTKKKLNKSNINMLEVDADPDLLERNNYDPAKDPLVGKIFGGCKLISKIGEGGMGSVYKAYHIGLDKHVALKLLPPSHLDSAERVKRFKHEAKSAAKMEHPNIVQILNIGEEDNIHYIVMQFIDGEDLRQRLLRKGVFPPIEAIDICIQVAEGLNVAHKKGIIHRDIKPDNIMIEREGNIKITDFGLARQIEQGLDISKPGKALGTPYYMSPEQCSGKELDGRSDIYSLGVTLYHIVTGRRPFKGKNAVSTALMHIREPVTPPEKVNPNMPLQLADVILRMMEKNPADRFQTCDALVKELKKVKNSILNAAELEPLVTSDDLHSERLNNTLVSPESIRKQNLADMRKKIGITAGIGMAALIIAIIIIISMLGNGESTGDKEHPNGTKPGNHQDNIFEEKRRIQREKKASEVWTRTKREIEQMKDSFFFVNALSKNEEFIEKYTDTKAGLEAVEYKKELLNYIETKTQKEFEKTIKTYDEFLSQKKYVEALSALNNHHANLTNKKIEDEFNKRRKTIEKLIDEKWKEIRVRVDELIRKNPPHFFDALEILENTKEIGYTSFDENLKHKRNRVQRQLTNEVKDELKKKKNEFDKQVKLIKKLELFLKSELANVKFNSDNIDKMLDELQKSINDCDKYTYVLSTFELIKRDLQALKFFRDAVVVEIFGNYAKKGRSIDIVLKDATKFEGEVRKSDLSGIEIRGVGETKTVSWNELSPTYLANEAYKHINPKIDEVKSLAVPLYLFSVGEYDLAAKYVPQPMQNKIAWRFHKPKLASNRDWSLFRIYSAELIGLDYLISQHLKRSRPEIKTLRRGLLINPKSGWINIALAVIAAQNKKVNNMLTFLQSVQKEYTSLKEYLKLCVELMIHEKKFSEARTYLSALDKNFKNDDDVMILWARLHMESKNNALALGKLHDAQKLYPLNKEIWLMLKKLQ